MKKDSVKSELIDYAGGHSKFLYLSWFFAAISAILAFFPFLYIWSIIKEILLVSPNFSQATGLVHKGWMAFLFAVLSVLVYMAGLMCSHAAAFRVASNIRSQLTHHILKLPLNFVDHFGSGNLRKIIDEGSASTENYLAHNLPDQTVATTTFLGLIFLLLYFDWRLGLISLSAILIAFAVMGSMTRKSANEGMEKYMNALSDISNESVEYIRGISVVKTFGQTVFSLRKFTDSINRYQDYVIGYTKGMRRPMVIYTTLINSVFAFLLAGGMFFTRHGVTTEFTLNFIFYLVITPLTSVVLSKIMYLSQNKTIVKDALNRVHSVLEQEPLSESSESQVLPDYSIDLSDVTYSYNGENLAVDHLSMYIGSGEKVALVGLSGSGKSTVASLMSRFFDPQSGEIKIGGINIKDIPKNELMETISFVFQRNILMKTSILENVRMGNPAATEEEVVQALTAAQCTDIIEKMPQGIYTQIGVEGTYLSGGEVQRIIIARAILKNSPILILDEATAFADADNELRIQEALNELSKNKTVIIIAHRLSTITDVDNIFVLKNGDVCESGSPNELRESGGIFDQMWKEYETSIQWKV